MTTRCWLWFWRKTLGPWATPRERPEPVDQMVVTSAIGGDTVTTTVEGRERYAVNVRYFRDYRSDLDQLRRVMVPAMDGRTQIPVGQLAEVRLASGPAMLRNENGMLTGYVYVDVAGRDIGSYVTEAKRVVAQRVTLPVGYSLAWSGQYEAMERVRERLNVVLPITLPLVLTLLYLNTRSLVKTSIIMLAVPFSPWAPSGCSTRWATT